jgi:opacity protein-like surface antigen
MADGGGRLRKIVGMKRLAGLLCCLLFASAAFAQDADKDKNKKEKGPDTSTPKYQITVGYEYRSYYPNNMPRFGTNGFDVTYDYSFFRHFLSLVADATGTYRSQGQGGYTDIYTLMAGPRVYPFGHRHKFTVYGEGLFGDGYIRNKLPFSSGFPGTLMTDNRYAFALGGGVEYRLGPRWSIRAAEFDYESTRFFSTAGTTGQSNYRFSFGVTRRFGHKD